MKFDGLIDVPAHTGYSMPVAPRCDQCVHFQLVKMKAVPVPIGRCASEKFRKLMCLDDLKLNFQPPPDW